LCNTYKGVFFRPKATGIANYYRENNDLRGIIAARSGLKAVVCSRKYKGASQGDHKGMIPGCPLDEPWIVPDKLNFLTIQGSFGQAFLKIDFGSASPSPCTKLFLLSLNAPSS
jgi:hypothetical protein